MIEENQFPYDKSLKGRILELLAQCPYEPNPKTCGLYEIRLKTLEGKMEWFRNLTHAEARWIIDSHKRCSTRQKAQISNV